jgi:hypothetical protein
LACVEFGTIFKELKMEKQIDAVYKYLIEHGVIGVRIWNGERIYFPTPQKGAFAFIGFDAPGSTDYEYLYADCYLRVYQKAPEYTSTNWAVSQAKQIKHGLMKKLRDIELVDGDICENWQDVIL